MDKTVGIMHLVTDLEAVNTAAFSGDESAMHAAVREFMEASGAFSMLTETMILSSWKNAKSQMYLQS